MWMIAAFDLPTETKEDRRAYRLFRDFLLQQGFQMLQYSIYARHVPSSEYADACEGRIEAHLPPEGEVRVLRVTTVQFRNQRIFISGKYRSGPDPPEQLSLI